MLSQPTIPSQTDYHIKTRRPDFYDVFYVEIYIGLHIGENSVYSGRIKRVPHLVRQRYGTVSTIDAKEFLKSSKSAVHGLRRAFAEILAAAGADPLEPQEISRRFGLDKTLTWRIARVVREEDAWEAVPHIPRRPSIGLFVDAMTRHGVPSERIETLWKAVGEFENFIELHTGDRETLEIMVGSAANRSAERRMEVIRKDGYQANSAIWGIRARLQVAFTMMVPAADPEYLDLATVCGLIDLRRLRPNVPWAIASATQWGYADTEHATAAADRPGPPIPLHPGGLINRVPVLPEFSSQPLPNLRTVLVPGGNKRFEITDGEIGNTGSSSVFLGWKWPTTATRYETQPGELGEHGAHLTTPAEALVIDLFIHRSLDFAMNPFARVYSQMPGGPKYPTEGPAVGLLPMPTDVIDLGSSPPETTVTEIPRYREIVAFAAERSGCSLNDLQGYRYRLKFPPIPAIAILQHPLARRS